MVGVVKKKGSSLSPERVAGLNSSIDFNGTKCATCTCDGENAFYITGPNMGKNLYIGKDVEPGHNPTIDYTTNAGTVEIGTNIKNIGGPLTGDSFSSTIAVGERLTVGNGDYVFGAINCNNNPRAKCADIHNRLLMVGREITVGNVCNTNWYAREQQIFGCAIKIDTCLPEAQRTNACGYTTFNGNSDTVLGRNVCYNHRYQDNPGRTVIVSGWSGRYCTTDSVYVGGSNRSWLVTSDNPITGVVSVQCPYGSCTSIDPLPSAQLQGTVRNAVVGTGNSIWSNHTAMLGSSHITTSDPFPAYYDGTSNRANCIPTNLVVIGQGNTVWGEDNVAIGRNSHAHGYRNYVIGTDSVAYGTSNVVIGSAACARFNGTSGADTQASRVFGNVVIGAIAKAGQYSNVAIGYLANAYCWDGVAIGHCAQALSSATAVGMSAKACNTSALALGYDSSALGVHSTAVGFQACAPLNCSTAFGFQSCACGLKAVALGPSSQALCENATAVGVAAKANGVNSVAVGVNSNVTTDHSIAIGVNSKGTAGGQTIAIGNNASTTGDFGVALSTNSKASTWSLALGVNSCSLDNKWAQISIGPNTCVCGTASISIGRFAQTISDYSMALGYQAQGLKGWAGTQVIGNFTADQKAIITSCFNNNVNCGLAIPYIRKSMHSWEIDMLWWAEVSQAYIWQTISGIIKLVNNKSTSWNGAINSLITSDVAAHAYRTAGNRVNLMDNRKIGTCSTGATCFNSSAMCISDFVVSQPGSTALQSPSGSTLFKIFAAADGTMPTWG